MAQRSSPRDKMGRLLLAFLLLAVIGFVVFPFVGSYDRMKERVKTLGMLRLQSWAVTVLNGQPKVTTMTAETVRVQRVPITDLPVDIAKLADGPVVIKRGIPDLNIQDSVVFTFGSAGEQYELVVGRSGFVPLEQKGMVPERLADGVWGIKPK